MARKTGRSAFNANAIGGAIDDILPKREQTRPVSPAVSAVPDAEPQVPAAADPAAPTTVATAPPPAAPADVAEAPAEPAESRSRGPAAKRRPGPKRTKGSATVVDLDATIGRKVRRAHNKDGRSYSVMVLEAIQKNAQALSVLWTAPAAGEEDSKDTSKLFPGLAAGSQSRRRREEVVRLTLSGINEAHLATLDQLEQEWNAPSRVVLIEEALRLEYLPKSGEADE